MAKKDVYLESTSMVREVNRNQDLADKRTAANDRTAASETARVKSVIREVKRTARKTKAEKQADKVAAATVNGTVAKSAGRHRPKNRTAGHKPPANPHLKPITTKPTAKTAKALRAKRRKLANKIPAKYKTTRVAAKALMGLGWYSWRAAASTAKVTARASRAAGHKVAVKAESRKWTPKATGARMFSSSFMCCGKRFTSAELMNKHFLDTHMDEPRAFAAMDTGATLMTATTRRKAGKTLVLLGPDHLRHVPTGRHRLSKKVNPNRRATVLVATYRNKITEIGVRAVSDNGPSRNLAQAANAWGEQRPRRLSELREISAGVERAMLQLGDALATYERYLNSPGDLSGAGGLHIDKEVTKAAFARSREGAAMVASGQAMFIALFEDAYAPYLRTARTLSTPNLDFGK